MTQKRRSKRNKELTKGPIPDPMVGVRIADQIDAGMASPWLAGIRPGWHSLVLPLIEQCDAEGVPIAQVKEKFGGLRFYMSPPYGAGSEKLRKMIAKAEDASLTICQECGEPGTTRSWGGYWILTLCPTHGETYRLSRASL